MGNPKVRLITFECVNGHVWYAKTATWMKLMDFYQQCMTCGEPLEQEDDEIDEDDMPDF